MANTRLYFVANSSQARPLAAWHRSLLAGVISQAWIWPTGHSALPGVLHLASRRGSPNNTCLQTHGLSRSWCWHRSGAGAEEMTFLTRMKTTAPHANFNQITCRYLLGRFRLRKTQYCLEWLWIRQEVMLSGSCLTAAINLKRLVCVKQKTKIVLYTSLVWK